MNRIKVSTCNSAMHSLVQSSLETASLTKSNFRIPASVRVLLLPARSREELLYDLFLKTFPWTTEGKEGVAKHSASNSTRICPQWCPKTSIPSLLYPCFKTALCYGVVSGCFVHGVSPSRRIRPEPAPEPGLEGSELACRTPESARKIHAKSFGP